MKKKRRRQIGRQIISWVLTASMVLPNTAVLALRKEKIKQTGAEPAKKARVKAEPAKKERVKAEPAKAKQVKTKQVGAAQVKVKPVERAEVKRKKALRLVPGQMIAEQTGNPGTVLT